MSTTKIMAHRGASGYAPENTMIAFELAEKMDADFIELDVHICKSGELIVCHDETVDRTTNGSGYIKDLTLNELKMLDAGSYFDGKFSDAKIPTFIEVLDWIKDRSIGLNIELKNAPIFYPRMEEEVLNLIEKYNLSSRVIISSFNHYSLAKCKQLDPNVKTGLLYMAGLFEPWNYCQSVHADAIHPLFYGVVPEIIKGCKENKIAINAWTVNDEPYMRSLIELGIEGIITDFPDKARKILNDFQRKN